MLNKDETLTLFFDTGNKTPAKVVINSPKKNLTGPTIKKIMEEVLELRAISNKDNDLILNIKSACITKRDVKAVNF